MALEGEAEGPTHCEVAVRLWGAERVAEEWWSEGWMLGRVKRRRRRAKTVLEQFRDMATGTEPDAAHECAALKPKRCHRLP